MMNPDCPKCRTHDCPHPIDKDGNIIEPNLHVPCFACPANDCRLHLGYLLCNVCDLPAAMLDRYNRLHTEGE